MVVPFLHDNHSNGSCVVLILLPVILRCRFLLNCQALSFSRPRIILEIGVLHSVLILECFQSRKNIYVFIVGNVSHGVNIVEVRGTNCLFYR